MYTVTVKLPCCVYTIYCTILSVYVIRIHVYDCVGSIPFLKARILQTHHKNKKSKRINSRHSHVCNDTYQTVIMYITVIWHFIYCSFDSLSYTCIPSIDIRYALHLS